LSTAFKQLRNSELLGAAKTIRCVVDAVFARSLTYVHVNPVP
jgi:hypothetical protein